MLNRGSHQALMKSHTKLEGTSLPQASTVLPETARCLIAYEEHTAWSEAVNTDDKGGLRCLRKKPIR